MGLTKVTTKLTSLADPKKSFESLFLVVDPTDKTLKRLPAIPLQ